MNANMPADQPSLEQAAPSSEPTVVISERPEVTTVIERFDVTADRLDEAGGLVSAHVSGSWKTDAMFVGAVVLRSRDKERGGLSVYSQWHGLATDTLDEPPPAARSLRAPMAKFRMLDTRSYIVEFTRQAHPQTGHTRVSMRATPFAHFGIFDVTRENQDVLMDRAVISAPKSLGSPGLLAINFHRSVDGTQIVNLGTWNSLEKFDELLKQPGFKDQNQYFKGIADFMPDFFDVINVVVGSAPHRNEC